MTGSDRHRTPGMLAGLACVLAALLPVGCQTAAVGQLDGRTVRAQSAGAYGGADEMEANNRTLLERLQFWDHLLIAGIEVPPPSESVTLGADGLKAAPPPPAGSYAYYLAGAHELSRQGRIAEAGKVFKYLADRERVPPQVAEEARYYEAECYRAEGYYPAAAETYTALLNKFPSTLYREQAVQHLYDIANYWLDDTRARLKEVQEYNAGQRWWVDPRFISFERSKPFLDREGNALKYLEQVRYNDINGPLADKALFLCGMVNFFNANYREADYFLTQIHERHPNSELAATALQWAIVSKHLSTGGSDYDGRKCAEARKLIDSALANYPELAAQREQMQRQRDSITYQQAEKDFKQAEFYYGRGQLGAAYFYYEMVKNTYKGTRFAQRAAERSEQVRADYERKYGSAPPAAPEPSPLSAPTGPGLEQAPAPTPAGQP